MTTDDDIRLTFHAMVARISGELVDDNGIMQWRATMTGDPFDALDIAAANKAIASGMDAMQATQVRVARKLAREFGTERVRRIVAFPRPRTRVFASGEDPHATPPASAKKSRYVERRKRRDPHVQHLKVIK